MVRRLSPSQQALLKEVLGKKSEQLRDSVLDLSQPPSALIGAICEILLEEFCETGLREDDEPNERGIALEALIDQLRRLTG